MKFCVIAALAIGIFACLWTVTNDNVQRVDTLQTVETAPDNLRGAEAVPLSSSHLGARTESQENVGGQRVSVKPESTLATRSFVKPGPPEIPRREILSEGNGVDDLSPQGQFNQKGVSRVEPLTPRILELAQAGVVEEVNEGDIFVSSSSPVFDAFEGLVSESDLVSKVKELSNDEQLTSENKAELISELDDLNISDAARRSLLYTIVDNENEDADVRVEALRKIADDGFSFVEQYSGHSNEEISSEVDLLQRLEQFKKQQKKTINPSEHSDGQ